MIQEKFDSKTLNVGMANIKEIIEVDPREIQEENETIQLPSEDKTSLQNSLLKREYVEKDDKIVVADEMNDDDISVNLEPQECFDQENNTYICPLCDYKAHSAPSLLRHHGVVHKGIRWKCKDCEFITRDKSSLKRHRRNRHEGIRFQCNYCDYDAGQKGNIKSHMDRKHPEIPYDHTEFQEVRIEKSKYSREAKQQENEMAGIQGGEAFNVNPMSGMGNFMPFNAHILSSFLQAKLREENNFVSTDDDSSSGFNSKLSNTRDDG